MLINQILITIIRVMKKSLQVYYSGSVQGVGFRWAAHSIANRLMLSGWVKNLSDGRVEVMAEGEESSLKDLLNEIREKMNYTHFHESISWSEASHEFHGFDIKF